MNTIYTYTKRQNSPNVDFTTTYINTLASSNRLYNYLYKHPKFPNIIWSNTPIHSISYAEQHDAFPLSE